MLGTKFSCNSLTRAPRGTVDSILPGAEVMAVEIEAVDEKKKKKQACNKLAVQAQKLL